MYEPFYGGRYQTDYQRTKYICCSNKIPTKQTTNRQGFQKNRTIKFTKRQSTDNQHRSAHGARGHWTAHDSTPSNDKNMGKWTARIAQNANQDQTRRSTTISWTSCRPLPSVLRRGGQGIDFTAPRPKKQIFTDDETRGDQPPRGLNISSRAMAMSVEVSS